MYQQGVGDFKYFVGIHTLDRIATRDDRICVLNILGGESSAVTPVSHAFSGGNVVFGTSPGKKGQLLKTPAGEVPVYNNVREGLDAGLDFNTGVVYLPPAGVRDGVAELIRVNPGLRKVIIVTEKVAVHDAREIRAMAQQAGVDIFGANCLGVADAWNRVRIGGALGGDAPEESLLKGSVAVYSNSGNFTTTIAQYLATEGWGTTTSVSSGKDVYIHFALPEFVYALSNDRRSRAAVVYVEPGGYYEHGLQFTKPVVACVVGRWKAKLTRAVGHAGALGGDGDDAAAKERWFQEAFGVDSIFTPDNPVVSARGAVVTNIAHIPLALTQVMALNHQQPDFAPKGDLSLKPWFGDNRGLDLPPELDLPVQEAIEPYNRQIASLSRQIGRSFPRQPMKDASGVSQMDAKSQITRLHNQSILDSATQPLESNLCQALTGEHNGDNDNILTNVAIAGYLNLHGDIMIQAADAAREAGNAPNVVLSAALAMLGPNRIEAARRGLDTLIDLFAHSGLENAHDEGFDLSGISISNAQAALFVGDETDPRAEAMLRAIRARGGRSLFIHFIELFDHPLTRDGVLAAIAATIAWGPLMRKRISRTTARSLPWYLKVYASLIGASADGSRHQPDSYCGVPNDELLNRWTVGEMAYLSLMGERGDDASLYAFQVLTGLLTSNGPGSISAQGCKGAVSSDGPETPARVQINKAMIGFMSHCGFSHGGAGYEGITFLVDRFRDTGLTDAGDAEHGLDLDAMAEEYAREYGQAKQAAKDAGAGRVEAIAGINHPVFKDKPVNLDPREAFITRLFADRGDYNVFHEYYKKLVTALFQSGTTRNVFCVNIDGVISALLLKMLWPRFRAGTLDEQALEVAAFTIFLYGRMIGCAAEIDDHINRGKNMDTRTPASKLEMVS
jgi:succinyl-CoA synthetase alpha subunit